MGRLFSDSVLFSIVANVPGFSLFYTSAMATQILILSRSSLVTKASGDLWTDICCGIFA